MIGKDYTAKVFSGEWTCFDNSCCQIGEIGESQFELNGRELAE
jgi:hypothetical protein